MLRYLPPPPQKKYKKSVDVDCNALEITEDEIQAATYDALPQDYKTHINSQYESDWQDMDDNDFLDAMLSYKLMDNTQRLKKAQKEKKRKEWTSKKSSNLSEGDSESQRRNKRPYARSATGGPMSQTTARIKKFCQHCKDSNGKYWTHNTVDCYFKKPAKESNAIKAVQKELDKVKSLIKTSGRDWTATVTMNNCCTPKRS